MNSPHITAGLAAIRRADLVADAAQARLVRASPRGCRAAAAPPSRRDRSDRPVPQLRRDQPVFGIGRSDPAEPGTRVCAAAALAGQPVSVDD